MFALLVSACGHRVKYSDIRAKTLDGKRVYWREDRDETFTVVDNVTVIESAKVLRGAIAGYADAPHSSVEAMGSEMGQPIVIVAKPSDDIVIDAGAAKSRIAFVLIVLAIVGAAVVTGLTVSGNHAQAAP